MLWFLALFCPPAALLAINKPGQAALNAILVATCVGWPPCVVWALLAVHEHKQCEELRRIWEGRWRGR